MEIIISIVALVAGISLYDYFGARRWQQVTSTERNELVFEHRNKAYGAYVIRKEYDKRLLIILGGLVLSLGVLYGVYMIYKSIPAAAEEETKIDMSQFAVVAPPVEEVEPPPVEEVIPPMERVIEFLPPEIVDRPITEIPPAPESDTKAGDKTNLVPDDKNFDPLPQDNTPAYVAPEPDPIFLDVEEPAEFPGGRAAMLKYLGDNMKYPPVAVENGIEGKCYLRFVVGTDGKISDVKVTRPVPDCPECDAEAKRVVRSMPKWKPGKNGGKGVKSYFDLPVNFKLN